jgi:hypothetical protein
MTMPWEPTGPERKLLGEALLSAFPLEQDLEDMLANELGETLDHVAGRGPLRTRVFQLTQWAVAQGKLIELLKAAHQANPGNHRLRLFIASLPPDVAREITGADDATGVGDLELPEGHRDRDLEGSLPWPQALFAMTDAAIMFVSVIVCLVMLMLLTRWLPQSSGPTAPPARVEAPDRRLTGTVTNEREEPLSGAQVTVDGHAEQDVTTTFGDFSLTLPASTADRVRLRVRKEGYQEWNARVSVPSRNVPIQLRKIP